MTRHRSTVLLAALSLLLTAPGTAFGAQTLQELLERTRNARAEEARIDAEREAAFLARREEQAGLLAASKQRVEAARARSEQLSKNFDANELKLDERETLLRSREGNLGELFGVTRQVAGDVSSVLYNSLTSAQFPGRQEFFAQLTKSKALPSTRDLERLWFELLREMTETGRVARFETRIVNPDGSTQAAQVVRVGGFIATSGDRYLSWIPTVGTLSVLPRQPSKELREIARGVDAARSGSVRSIVDPSRGALLALYVQRPNLWERIEKGEAVGYVILAVGLIGLVCSLYQFVYLVATRRRVTRQLTSLDRPATDNPLGRVLATFKGDPARIEDEAEVVELRISEAVLREVPVLERFQAFLRLAVSAGPLLGLIGTVIGMIITFQSITESGSSDPKLMANGIGQAMIATVLGLGIAIPLLFINAGLTSLSRSIVQILDEQSNGLLAEHIERQRAAGQAKGAA